MWTHDETRVFAVSGVTLRVVDGTWDFAAQKNQYIAEHWQRRLDENPKFFNGIVHVLVNYSLSAGGVFSGTFVRTDFKSFLYWRETGAPDPTVMDAFGSALILSSEGRVLLGRQRQGNLNGDLSYPPGGFIDVRDIAADGTIDLDGSVLREITEETGLDDTVLQRLSGYVVTIAGPVLSIAVPWTSALSEPNLISAVSRHIDADPDGELKSVAFVAPGASADGLAMPAYARALLGGLSKLKSLI
ncbi:NUDIX hydrolase [Hyphomicrobium sp. LHD-15]|uniref:NUDIX hydrolase n=1 Tax=Hyphomicrobium sp. LHD-15 TaxID=3072142 RepID=UPI00280F77F8|nr:NUDIX hydrolase [Hyphomicrobium sp. LHD-15]MDQ8697439.1 NUDIX hydrolase [Hyphomicrobium sp. LHD-15]